jgi:hypothetical protein
MPSRDVTVREKGLAAALAVGSGPSSLLRPVLVLCDVPAFIRRPAPVVWP